jgi:hypothetical protein
MTDVDQLVPLEAHSTSKVFFWQGARVVRFVRSKDHLQAEGLVFRSLKLCFGEQSLRPQRGLQAHASKQQLKLVISCSCLNLQTLNRCRRMAKQTMQRATPKATSFVFA